MQVISDIGDIATLPDDVCAAELASQRSTPNARPLASYDALDDEPESFDSRLLRALATMAARSKRRQADLSAALCRSGLAPERDALAPALRALELAGFIEHLVPLYDGGMLMSVTSRGIEQLTAIPRWAQIGEMAGAG
jgi:hypothetical protein